MNHWQTIEDALIGAWAIAWSHNEAERQQEIDAALAFVREMREKKGKFRPTYAFWDNRLDAAYDNDAPQPDS